MDREYCANATYVFQSFLHCWKCLVSYGVPWCKLEQKKNKLPKYCIWYRQVVEAFQVVKMFQILWDPPMWVWIQSLALQTISQQSTQLAILPKSVNYWQVSLRVQAVLLPAHISCMAAVNLAFIKNKFSCLLVIIYSTALFGYENAFLRLVKIIRFKEHVTINLLLYIILSIKHMYCSKTVL